MVVMTQAGCVLPELPSMPLEYMQYWTSHLNTSFLSERPETKCVSPDAVLSDEPVRVACHQLH